jgi:hypothetical protein
LKVGFQNPDTSGEICIGNCTQSRRDIEHQYIQAFEKTGDITLYFRFPQTEDPGLDILA